MDTNRKNEWIEEVLGSTEGSHRVSPPNGLYGKLSQRLTAASIKGRVISMNWVSAAAACLLLLISLNLYLANKHQPSEKGKDQVKEVVEYYDILNDKEMEGI
jgi:hypothetical protein